MSRSVLLFFFAVLHFYAVSQVAISPDASHSDKAFFNPVWLKSERISTVLVKEYLKSDFDKCSSEKVMKFDSIGNILKSFSAPPREDGVLPNQDNFQFSRGYEYSITDSICSKFEEGYRRYGKSDFAGRIDTIERRRFVGVCDSADDDTYYFLDRAGVKYKYDKKGKLVKLKVTLEKMKYKLHQGELIMIDDDRRFIKNDIEYKINKRGEIIEVKMPIDFKRVFYYDSNGYLTKSEIYHRKTLLGKFIFSYFNKA